MMDSRPDPADNLHAASANPYAAPQVDLTQTRSSEELAGRDKRLLASILDLLVFSPAFIIAFLFGSTTASASRSGFDFYRSTTSDITGAAGVIAFMFVICLIIVQLVFIARHGQTIGKRVLRIRVVRYSNGSICGLGRYFWLRTVVPMLIGSIPFVGNFFPIVDALFIFGAEKRCLHDLIADTKVVVA